MVPVAHGSDGGGSIRIPAACCGLVGLKPARGRISGAPYGDGLAGLGTNGALTVSVRDTAALLDVLSGYEPGDPNWAPPPVRPFLEEVGAEPGRLRIALALSPPEPFPVEEPCLAAARQAAELLTELGHEVVEIDPPWHSDQLLRLFQVPWAVGAKLYPVSDLSLLTPLNRALAEIAEATPSYEYVQAVAGLQGIARRFVAWSLAFDAVLTPALGKLPVPIGWIFEPDDPLEQFLRGGELTPFTPFVNVTGQPAIAVPFDVVEGLPVGIQLIGRPADEATLIRLASQLEVARPWAGRLPQTGFEL
jgi:amidase